MSTTAVPPRVTIEVSGNGHDGLVEDELVALLDELADLHARAVRFVGLASADEAISLRLLHRAGDLGIIPIVELTPRTVQMPDLVDRIVEIRPRRLAVRLDHPDPEANDVLTGMPCSWTAVQLLADVAARSDIQIEVDTLVRRELFDAFDLMKDTLREIGVEAWHLRVDPLDDPPDATTLTPAEIHELFDQVVVSCRESAFRITLEELPHFRRYLAQRAAEATDLAGDQGCGRVRVLDSRLEIHVTRGGEVYPSRLLRIPAGSVRRNVLRGIFMHHPTYRLIRESNRLRGRCGRCRYNGICGGSRARAWISTGDPLASDPACDGGVFDSEQPRSVRTRAARHLTVAQS